MRPKRKHIFLGLAVSAFFLSSALWSVYSLTVHWTVGPRSLAQLWQSVHPTPTPIPRLAFAAEVYSKIQQRYWEKISDEQLSNLYKLALEKLTEKPQTLESADWAGVAKALATVLATLEASQSNQLVTSLSDIVLANLKPFGRSRLYTVQQEQKLNDTVKNKDLETDLYAALGVDKTAPPEEIQRVYTAKKAELKNDNTPAAAEKLALLERAQAALTDPEQKKTYDTTGIEPTVMAKLLKPDIYYLKLTKLSPQSFTEFQQAANAIEPADKAGPTALILDLRGNVGGAIDLLQYFLGPFIGPDQYAYEFFHQGEKQPFKTKVGWLDSLVRYKKVIILIDGQVQSSGEVLAATLKKYNVGVLVGTPTQGWGTVESVIPLDHQPSLEEKYSMLLVHSLTLREDGEPIEGRGVEPTVNTQTEDWPQQLSTYFNYPALVTAVRELLK